MSDSDFLLTYNPECLERHSESSDFDDNETCQSGPTHSVLRRKIYRHTEMAYYIKEMRNKKYKNNFGQNDCVYDNHAIHPRQCNCNDCIIPVEEKKNQTCFKKRKIKLYDDEDDKRSLHRTASRMSVVRSKLMPCLSNIFWRSSHSKRNEPVKDQHLLLNSTKDHNCQVYCLNCNNGRFKKASNKHNYGVQSVFSDEEYSLDSGINIDTMAEKSDLNTDYHINYESNYPSSIGANVHIAKKKFKKMVEREFRKAYTKRHHLKQSQEQQFPSKPNFQIFSTPKMSRNENIQNNLNESFSFGCNVIPSNSSVFWEYLVERINKKYQNNNRGGLIRSCHCTTKCPNIPTSTPDQCSATCPNTSNPPNSLLHDGTGSQFDYKTNEQGTQGSVICSCKGTPNTGLSPGASDPNTQKQGLPGLKDKAMPAPPGINLSQPGGRKHMAQSKVLCKCHDGGLPKPQGGLGGAQGGGTQADKKPTTQDDDVNRPCQEPHAQIKETVEKRYNGEILCIHNPPCILINGCLNLPPVKGQFSSSAWPVTQVASFHYQKSYNQQNQEQGCQYDPSFSEFLGYTVTTSKTEKMTQSICNHNPPCEVVRCCYKPEFDPKLENSCVHVPNCRKLPACVLNNAEESTKCEHQPKCAEIPLCKRDHKKLVVLTARDDISVQVKPNANMECKHMPPCIMIPKCLGKLMCDGYVPYDAIPDCMHQPPCERIPACCRKSAKMVSASSQYPGACRIV